jgi:hypothetical protein
MRSNGAQPPAAKTAYLSHAMHWEEGRRGTPAHNMLLTLQADGLASVQRNKNNSLAILDALGWTSADEVVSSLEHLVK